MKAQKTTVVALFDTYPDVMSVQQVRSALKIGRTAVYRLLDSNEIQCFKIGNAYKIPKTSLIEFVQRNSEGGNAV